MSALYPNHLAPIRVQSDGRRYKRFVREDGISISFRGTAVVGNLANLSATGLLANFDSHNKFPAIAENVAVHIDVDGDANTMDVQGAVVRLQVPKDKETGDVIEMAINFIDLRPDTRHGIQKLIDYLLVKSKSYKV